MSAALVFFPPLLWVLTAALGIRWQFAALRECRVDLDVAIESGVPKRLIVMARNNVRRYLFRLFICANNLALGILTYVERPLPRSSLLAVLIGVYVLGSLIANEAIVVFLTALDRRTRKQVIALSEETNHG